jgi:hypothetical protein
MDKKEKHSPVDSSPLKGRAADLSEGGEADEISLKDLILKLQKWYRYLLSKWVIIVITGIIGGVVGLAYAYNQKTVYTAELTFVVESRSSGANLMSYAGLANQFGINMGSGGGGVFEGPNLFEFMKSRLVIEKALLTSVDVKGRKLTLAEYYINMKGLREVWVKNPKLKDINFLPGEDPQKFSLVKNALIGGFHSTIVEKNLVMGNKDKKSSILSMKVTSEDELFSKYFTEVLAKEVSELYIDTKTKKSIQNLANLQYQVDSVRREFNSAISEVAYTIDANPNPNTGRQSLQVPHQRKQVDVQANQAMLIELMKSLAVSRITLKEETPLIQTIDKPVLPLPRQDSSKPLGLILGGILGGVIAVFFLVVKKFFERIMV